MDHLNPGRPCSSSIKWKVNIMATGWHIQIYLLYRKDPRCVLHINLDISTQSCLYCLDISRCLSLFNNVLHIQCKPFEDERKARIIYGTVKLKMFSRLTCSVATFIELLQIFFIFSLVVILSREIYIIVICGSVLNKRKSVYCVMLNFLFKYAKYVCF